LTRPAEQHIGRDIQMPTTAVEPSCSDEGRCRTSRWLVVTWTKHPTIYSLDMQASFFAVLLGLSLLVILLGVLGRLAMRQGTVPRTPAKEPEPPQTAPDGPQSTILRSPVWNVVGVVAGVIGAVVSVIGLFR
jgi:hypothetical protein